MRQKSGTPKATAEQVVKDIRESVAAKSDMLVQIYMGLQKAGVEIPFPQRDIHLRASDPAPAKAEAKAEAPSETSNGRKCEG
ncbi:hypothetical protein H0I76_04655 [Limibaculum sp. M0105]|uniref:Uncharacterized protein n=1 Tax=Thermohalobaculum xanthum TaxID=2753746 RepID=A0A8J7M6K9_9RHOB|nr:hypothetical protein [Thermohalobaculum xanthum]MBK0398469.1 hypothetical protein [Thermohalobaculum xanthum]